MPTNPDLAALNEAATLLMRPIAGIENRTSQEVFDMMCDRIRWRLSSGDLVLIDREGMRERVHELLRAAYSEGATNVHDTWVAGLGQREADFGEAAHDYAGDTADAAIAAILGEGKP